MPDLWYCSECDSRFDLSALMASELSSNCPVCGALLTPSGSIVRKTRRRASALSPRQVAGARDALAVVRDLQPMTVDEAQGRGLLAAITAAMSLRWVERHAGGLGLTTLGAIELRAQREPVAA